MFKQLIKHYKYAKRTALLLQENLTRKWYHLFSVIELLPNEIPTYKIPAETWKKNFTRSDFSSQNDNYSCYLTVSDLDSVENACLLFNNPVSNNVIEGEENLFFNKLFMKEPSGGNPYVISSNIHASEGLISILPKRNSGGFLWTQIDTERKAQNLFYNEFSSKEKKAISQLTVDWLGFDIAAKPEHFGNIYLFAANPYYRDVNISLSTNPTGIFYHFKMRKEINTGFKIRIIDTHGDIIALDKTYQIENHIGLIELPHEPNRIELRVYDNNENLIGIIEPSYFTKSIHLNMFIQTAELQINNRTDNGSKEDIVKKYLNERHLFAGNKSDFNSTNFFKDAANQRKYIVYENNKDFIFFPGAKSDIEQTKIKTKSKNLIRQMINESSDTCYLCDPYFSVKDLIEYAFYVENIGVKLRILNSKEFISKEDAKLLFTAIEEYNEKPFQKIECRLLRGDSILHDRFVISDKNVWFLGASFNEFGKRATCIGKVPDSSNVQIIREVEKWFFNNEYSIALRGYVNE